MIKHRKTFAFDIRHRTWSLTQTLHAPYAYTAEHFSHFTLSLLAGGRHINSSVVFTHFSIVSEALIIPAEQLTRKLFCPVRHLCYTRA